MFQFVITQDQRDTLVMLNFLCRWPISGKGLRLLSLAKIMGLEGWKSSRQCAPHGTLWPRGSQTGSLSISSSRNVVHFYRF